MRGLIKKFKISANTRMVVFLSMVFLFMFFVLIYVFLANFGTEIGKDGYKIVFIKNLLTIVIGIRFLIMCLYCFNNHKKIVLMNIAIGLLFIIVGSKGVSEIINEKQNDLITEKLSNIIVSLDRHNIKIDGVVKEEKRYFIFRGKDKLIAKKIKNSNSNYIIIVYHSSTHRIESITIPDN